MATETNLYKAYLASPEIEQGQHQWKKMLQEDKILQNFILRQGGTIAYARKALVYDEKVDTGAGGNAAPSAGFFPISRTCLILRACCGADLPA